MSGLGTDSILGTGVGASSTVASALAPRRVAAQATAHAAAANGSSTNTSANAATGAADITSNDFLTLLVSELKNQDPTQPTDPNAYIQQLVGVNSLQQLIQINQGLSTVETPATTGSSATSQS